MPMRSKGYAKVHLQRKHAWRRALIVFCTKTFALARWVWSVIIGRQMQRVRWQTVLWHCTALTITFVFVAPFFWVLTSSLRPLGLPPPRALEWAPQELAWTNYAEIFRIAPLGRQIGNSILVSTVGAALTLITASAAGFAMAQTPERRGQAARRPGARALCDNVSLAVARGGQRDLGNLEKRRQDTVQSRFIAAVDGHLQIRATKQAGLPGGHHPLQGQLVFPGSGYHHGGER